MNKGYARTVFSVPGLIITSVLLVVVSLSIFLVEARAVDRVNEHNVQKVTQSESLDLAKYQTFPELADYLEGVARDRGGATTFELMSKAKLPPNIDTHLLGHVVGDVLYEQEGLQGMSMCTDVFRNACSHSIVVGALLDDGMGVFDEINRICEQAPGNSGLSYNMCFHGFGHGVLAYTNYNLEKAVELCQLTGTAEHNYYEFNECIGGVIMEMDGGIHDPVTWEREAHKYLDEQDPAYLCEHDFMPESVRDMCYIYLTPFIFNLYADGAFPDKATVQNSFAYCSEITNTEHRQACYGGIGKEIPGLLVGRDVSLVGVMDADQLAEVESWCATANTQEGYDTCNNFVLTSLYWGGENSYNFPKQYCDLIQDEASHSFCINALHDVVSYYFSPEDVTARMQYCDMYTDEEKQMCYQRMSL